MPQSAEFSSVDAELFSTQGDETVEPTLIEPITPDSIVNNVYAFCYISVGTKEVPDFTGTLVAQSTDGSADYYTVENKMGTLEKVLSALSDGGYESTARQDIAGVSLDSGASTGLLIVMHE